MDYKGYKIVGDGTFGMKKIKYPGVGGGLPKQLEGSFTKAQEAMWAIDYYLAVKQAYEDKPEPIKKVKLYPREVKKDGATESDSTD